MFKWIVKHKWIILMILFFFIAGIPLIIHILFKINSGIEFLEAEWTAGEALSFYGSFLSFAGTAILGTLTLYQNQIIKEEADKRAKLIEEREYDMQMPKFSVKPHISNGDCANLGIYIENTSENIASEIVVSDIKVICPDGTIFWSFNRNFTYDSIRAGDKADLRLTNPTLQKDDYVFIFTLQCKDKFETIHTYMVKGIYKRAKHYPDFKVTEIK